MGNGITPGAVWKIPGVVAASRDDPLVHSRISSRMYTEWQNATVDILVRAAQIKIPFLILTGTADPLIDTDSSRRLHELTSSLSQLHILEGRYHVPFNHLGSYGAFQLVAVCVLRS